jgi:hypothetical protein
MSADILQSSTDVSACSCAQITLPAVDEKKKVIEDVDKDRKYAIDAAIVRTMKSRKVLGHQHVRLSCPAPLDLGPLGLPDRGFPRDSQHLRTISTGNLEHGDRPCKTARQ